MPANFVLSEIMLKSYIGYEIMLYENMLFTAHLQVLQPYIRIESEQTARAPPVRVASVGRSFVLPYVPCALGT